MKFSILIAHYNNAEYFKDCYQSIINQNYQNWEAIILDDGSKIEEKQKVKEIIADEPRIKFYENEINKGVGYTKKKLIELADGDVCGFLDPDDALSCDAITLAINEYSNDKIIATYSKFYNCDKDLNVLSLFKHTREIPLSKPLFLNVRFEIAHFFTFKKEEYLKTNRLDESLSSSIDQDLYLKLYELGNFKYIKKPLYYYRLHQNGVSQDLNKKNKLHQNWHTVLYNTLLRRGIKNVYGTDIDIITDLPTFIFEKQNTFVDKILRKLHDIFEQ